MRHAVSTLPAWEALAAQAQAKRAATLALSLGEKWAGQRRVKALETERNNRRKTLFEAQDKIDAQRERLIAGMEGKLKEGVERRGGV